MKMKDYASRSAMILLAVLMLTSCASTRMVSNWSDIGSQQPLAKKLLIVGAADDLKIRTLFEETLAAEFTQKGIQVVKSTDSMDGLNPDADTALAEAHRQGIDFVLLTQVVEIGEKDTWVPEYNPILHAYESGGNYYGMLEKFRKNRRVPEKFVKLQTRLYDAETKKVIWSAVSETTKPDSTLTATDVIESVCTIISERLQPTSARG